MTAEIKVSVLSLLCLFSGFFASGELMPPIPCTKPVVTVHFPGGNFSHVSVTGNLAAVSSGWSRNDGAAIFDLSDPLSMKLLARFPARGYSLSSPVFFGDRCYIPNGFCATVISLADKSAPVLEGYLNPSFPKSGCKRLWIDNGSLYFESDDGCRKVLDDGFSSAPADVTPPKPEKETSGRFYIEDSMLKTPSSQTPFVHNLSSIAVKDGVAYIWAQHDACSRARLLKLDVSSSGNRLFSSFTEGAVLPKPCSYMTMGMQTAGSVTRRGDLFFTDDGIMRMDRKGGFETLLARTKPVSNSSIDGDKIALAQCTRCRVMDFSDTANVVIRDFVPSSDKPLHITGCDLKGDDLYIAYTLVEEKGMDFIYRFPKKGYVAHFRLSGGPAPVSVIETFPCIALARAGDSLYLTGRGGDFGIIDISRSGAMGRLNVRTDLLDGDGYKIKSFNGGIFLLNGKRILKLRTDNPSDPQVDHIYARGHGTNAPGYDDFTIENGRLYALAHSSLDVFILGDPDRTRAVENDIGAKGYRKVLEPADKSIFDGHVRAAGPLDTIRFQGGNFDNYFGACVLDFAEMGDGSFVVAYGEGSLVFCNKNGTFKKDLPRYGYGPQVFAAEVLVKDGKVYVKDGEGNVWLVPEWCVTDWRTDLLKKGIGI